MIIIIKSIIYIVTTTNFLYLALPSQPSLNGSTMSALTVRLTWERPVGNIIRYIITYFPVNEPSQQYNDIVLDSTGLTTIVGNLLPNTTYQFVIQAVNDHGASLPSDPVILTTFLQSGEYVCSLMQVRIL